MSCTISETNFSAARETSFLLLVGRGRREGGSAGGVDEWVGGR